MLSSCNFCRVKPHKIFIKTGVKPKPDSKNPITPQSTRSLLCKAIVLQIYVAQSEKEVQTKSGQLPIKRDHRASWATLFTGHPKRKQRWRILSQQQSWPPAPSPSLRGATTGPPTPASPAPARCRTGSCGGSEGASGTIQTGKWTAVWYFVPKLELLFMLFERYISVLSSSSHTKYPNFRRKILLDYHVRLIKQVM